METPLFLRRYYFVRLYFPLRKICIHVVYSISFWYFTEIIPTNSSFLTPSCSFPVKLHCQNIFLIKIHFQDL